MSTGVRSTLRRSVAAPPPSGATGGWYAADPVRRAADGVQVNASGSERGGPVTGTRPAVSHQPAGRAGSARAGEFRNCSGQPGSAQFAVQDAPLSVNASGAGPAVPVAVKPISTEPPTGIVAV